MTLTPLIEKAIKTASILHDGQKRRGEKDFPYVTHLFSVAAILSEHTSDEETIVAGILHDSIEDTPYTMKELEFEFGETVAEIVEGVTEEKSRGGKKLSWRERKEGAIEKLKDANRQSLLVITADKIHNLQSVVDDYKKHGSLIWNNFNAPVDEQFWYYREILGILEARLDNSIVQKYKALVLSAERELKK